MRCFSIQMLAAATCLALIPLTNDSGNHAWSQDITITIKKDKDGDAEADDEKVKGKSPFKGKRPAVDVAILLDTSNSMDGLISQAKKQLWKIIQQFADAEKAGQTPILRVSVFEYGNSGLPASEGYIRQVCQLTDDLDKVSESLFGLSTNGGDEYCGTVIEEALKRLDWSSKDNAYKAIFIAGNEPFTQGSVDYKKSCRKAIQNGVVVNTIHCGDRQTGINGKWKHGADLAEGKYLNIDQDRQVVHIKAPQDKIIIELNTQLNKTYLWFGQKDQRDYFESNQAAQDSNALKSNGGEGYGGRGGAKASPLYRNAGRDLVDTLEEDSEALAKIQVTALPEAMQAMSTAQRTAYIQQMAAKRAEIKKKMIAATNAREAYVAEKMRASADVPGASTLGDAISGAVREQLKESGFELNNEK